MVLFFFFGFQGRDDLDIVRDLLLQTESMTVLKDSLITPLERRLSRFEGRVEDFNAAVLVANANQTLDQAIASAVAEGERINKLTDIEREDLKSKLRVSGLTGNALQAKVASFKALWHELREALQLLKEGRLHRSRLNIHALLDLLKDIWSSLKKAIPGAEEVEEALGVIAQLLHLADIMRGPQGSSARS